ncbi:acetyl-CoA carboxylase, biotin carboxyl carrier protein [Pirellula staleyi DSM 6068]|uniref:Biotin carboxyl carrier protein of acetyl-CoA carboxylase n=1 Tax=Pirellula staleyi (strain ATCC 27377 / DSM 6068 / ICPB 4128) TaxID=530564 RepID=D2R639_PIRSD|nr:acetyl-CoA carboxylase biotin carboxyl carrier protein [Pirellula staleyi]ADB19124.1 acetyl-CoA carboxylase, biotin carboxyl carrier protein [Pirellula staleyi DSM 6068]
MTDASSGTDGQESVFEVQRIRRLVELMKEHDLSEIDLREQRHRIRICRGPKLVAAPAVAAAPAAAPAPAAPAAAPSAPVAAAPAGDGPGVIVIKSPMVGTFYSKPNPKAETYVKVGDRVDSGTIICLIEAMKVYNEIPAEVKGKIVAVMVNDGEAVEFDKPLFKVDTNG